MREAVSRAPGSGVPPGMLADNWLQATRAVDHEKAEHAFGWHHEPDAELAYYFAEAEQVAAVLNQLAWAIPKPNDAYAAQEIQSLLRPSYIRDKLKECNGDPQEVAAIIMAQANRVMDQAYERTTIFWDAMYGDSGTSVRKLTSRKQFLIQEFFGFGRDEEPGADDVRAVEARLGALEDRLCRLGEGEHLDIYDLRRMGIYADGYDSWRIMLGEDRGARIDPRTLRLSGVQRMAAGAEEYLAFTWRSVASISDGALSFGRSITQRFSEGSDFVARFAGDMAKMAGALDDMSEAEVEALQAEEARQLAAEQERKRVELARARREAQDVAHGLDGCKLADGCEPVVGALDPFSSNPALLQGAGQQRQWLQPLRAA